MKVSGLQYVQNYGPTVGDKIRLGDTNLVIEVEKDYTVYGEECKFGGGKTLREGMGQSSTVTSANGALDLVITNCVVLDYTGIYKCDIGLKDGYIAGLGKAGNPDIMDGVDPKMVVGCSTEALAGEGLIVTAGGTDLHIHWICPQQVETALLSGITTMGGGGTGPADGTNATTCTPGPFYIKEMLKSFEDMPMNIVLYGKGNGAIYKDIAEQVEAGASGLKLHEDWGTTPAAIDMCLNVCDDYDVMCAIHTDTLNEAGCVEDTMTAIKGRVMHTFHSEGAGGGHAPDIISVSGYPNIIPSSTNPTMPHTLNTIDEHLDMLMVCHHLDNRIPEDVAFADSRIRPETIKAEDVLHDMGIFSMMSSDSQAMGRPAEVITRTWQCAHKMKEQRGKLPEDSADNDNFRAKRYVAKYTINPAIACGTSYILGSVEVGKFADLVLWDPKFFGIKPKMVIKGGVITASEMGDANASIPTVEPIILKYMFGAYGTAVHDTCITFVSQASLDNGMVASYNLKKRILPVKGTRTIGKKDMKFNDVCADVKVDPETYVVTVNGKQATCEIANSLPLTQLYNLF